MIEVIDVGLTIKKERILNQISMEFEEGEIYGFVGRNGSGKTMLMKCICGFVKVTEGKILVEGKEVRKEIDFPKDMGIIIETPGFIPYYSGYKNLRLLSRPLKKVDKQGIYDAMICVGLAPSLRRHVRKYSLGMRQRLGIAQAIMENPKLLILDEPFNGLDSEGVVQMRQLLLELKGKGKTIILASHSSEDIDVMCDQVYLLEKGELVE